MMTSKAQLEGRIYRNPGALEMSPYKNHQELHDALESEQGFEMALIYGFKIAIDKTSRVDLIAEMTLPFYPQGTCEWGAQSLVL